MSGRPGAAGGDQQLLLDDVDAGDELGHGVLDLQARVHLQEHVVLARRVDEALDSARVLVVDGLGGPHRAVEHALPELITHTGRRRFLGNLLMPPLHRAVALAQRDDPTVG